MREKGVRNEGGEAFLLLKMPMNAETRPTHICAIERAAHIFISYIHSPQEKEAPVPAVWKTSLRIAQMNHRQGYSEKLRRGVH